LFASEITLEFFLLIGVSDYPKSEMIATALDLGKGEIPLSMLHRMQQESDMGKKDRIKLDNSLVTRRKMLD
jgi:hypothetical protein